MRQHYHLGQLLRRRYITDTYSGFLTDNYTRTEVYVRSTDYDRTLMSVEAQLSALFPPVGEWRFHDSLQWQPIPVHTQPKSQDNLLRGHTADCPVYAELRREELDTAESKAIEEEYYDFFQKLKNYTGVVPLNLSNIWEIEDTLFVENASMYGLPSWLSPEELASLRNLSAYTLSFMFDSLEKKRLTAGTWVEKVRNDTFGRVAGEPSLNGSKLFLYSAHDTTMATMMAALGVWDGKLPAYASAFLIELLSDDQGYYIQMFHRNDTFSDDIRAMSVPGCAGGTRCTLEEFKTLTDPILLEDDWQRVCGNTSSGGDGVATATVVLAVLFGVCVLLAAGLVVALCVCGRKRWIMSVLLCKCVKKRRPKYRRVEAELGREEGDSSAEDGEV